MTQEISKSSNKIMITETENSMDKLCNIWSTLEEKINKLIQKSKEAINCSMKKQQMKYV